MVRKIFKLIGEDKFAIGVFDNGELLKGRPLRKFKTKKGAEKALLNDLRR